MKNANQLEKLIYSMLIENTGINCMDSGGSNNRGWQKNQKKKIKDFQNENEVSYYMNTEYKYHEIERTVSVFHYLQAFYELDSVCDKFNRINKNCKNWDSDLYGVSDRGEKFLNSLDAKIKRTWNTYNGDSDLSQILQGTELEINGDEYCLIQIHNGADARGGYTDAKLFLINYNGDYIMDYMSQDEILREELEYVNVYDQNGDIIELEKLNEIFNLV
jgi:hypothetical protein